ncbi:cell envelope integrity protein TolA, partial [Aspergillus brunneoviolaceus CBS 621.78]
MLFQGALFAALLGTTVASSGSNSKCLSSNTVGAANYQLCCPEGRGSGKGTVGDSVFEFTCGQYLTGKSGAGTQHRQVNSAKDCAQLCSSPDCPGASWHSTGKKCFVLGSGNTDYAPYSPARDWMVLTKSAETPEDPDPEEDCKEFIDAAKETAAAHSQCQKEKDEIRQQGDSKLQQCQADKDSALTNANAQCATEKDQLQKLVVDDARSQCKSEKDAAASQCEKEKDEIRKQGESQLQQSKSQCDAEKAGLQQKIKELEEKASSVGSGTGGGQWLSVDEKCRSNSWRSLCDGTCSQRQFTLGGVDFQVKCNVRTNGAVEEIWWYRQSILECAEACALNPRCLGVGWR